MNNRLNRRITDCIYQVTNNCITEQLIIESKVNHDINQTMYFDNSSSHGSDVKPSIRKKNETNLTNGNVMCVSYMGGWRKHFGQCAWLPTHSTNGLNKHSTIRQNRRRFETQVTRIFLSSMEFNSLTNPSFGIQSTLLL